MKEVIYIHEKIKKTNFLMYILFGECSHEDAVGVVVEKRSVEGSAEAGLATLAHRHLHGQCAFEDGSNPRLVLVSTPCIL